MKKAAEIFKRDVLRLWHNRTAMLVVIGIMIIPSLYAWFNIAANYDPYSNTGEIKVAVANEDRGTETALTGELNAGNAIEAKLKENHDLGWTFVKRDEAIEGVKSGRYYAAILIPEDFSSQLTDILEGKVQRPVLNYYVNEKKNAIAPKITDTGASTLQVQIDETFSQVASESISETLKRSAGDITAGMTDTQQDLYNALRQTKTDVDDWKNLIQNFQSEADKSHEDIAQAAAMLDEMTALTQSGSTDIQTIIDQFSTDRTVISRFATGFSTALSSGEATLNTIHGDTSVKLSDLEAQIQKINLRVAADIESISRIIDQNTATIDELKQLNAKYPSAMLTQIINGLEAENNNQQAVLESLKQLNEHLNTMVSHTASSRQELETVIEDGKNSLSSTNSQFLRNTLPSFDQTMDRFSVTSGEVAGILNSTGPAITQMKTILSSLDQGMTDAASAFEATGTSLSQVSDKMDQLVSDVSALRGSEVYRQFEQLSALNSDQIADFMGEPVTIQTEKIYPVENYGSALAPFYTNLAAWVGGIVLIAIFKLEVDEDAKIKNLKPHEAYFGRLMLYLAVGICQALIIGLGDLLLLKIQCVNPVAFIAGGILCSIVYINIIYALSVTLKHIGKALSVILVILQIPGSAGTYPIEMTPGFFQAIHPFLPFTYGVGAMREAVAGIYPYHYLTDCLGLLAFIPVSLLIGLLLRPVLLNLNSFFDKRLNETDMLICEHNSSGTGENRRLAILAKAVASAHIPEETRKKEIKWIEQRYRKWIRWGFRAIWIIPLVFLILMFSLDSKLVFLVLWIVSIIVISGGLILTDYMYDKFKQQVQLEEKTKKMNAEAVCALFKAEGEGREDE